MPAMPTTLERYTTETPRLYYFDFSRFPEIADDADTLSSVVAVSSSPTGQTLGSGTISGTRVSVSVTGTTAGTYSMVCTVLTAGGSRLTCKGTLLVL